MKKLIAMTLALILCFSLVVPVSASEDVYMIFDGETDDGCSTHPQDYGRLWGSVGYNYDLGHPMPTQGENSYCLFTSISETVLYHNMNYNPGVTTTGTFDATKYDYIELDIYSHSAIVFNWEFGLCSDETDATGAVWGMEEVCIPEKSWTHFKMPISAFGDFPEAFPESSLDNINRIKLQITNIVDLDKRLDEDVVEAPYYAYIYFDNIIATTGEAGGDNELIDYNTILEGFPDWWPIIRKPNPMPIPYPIGDVNGDWYIDASDALDVLQHAVGKVFLGNTTKADVDGDGEVEATDALIILQYSVGKITKFPVEG